MKKVPWGILAGICAIFVFYLTVAFIGLNVIFGGIAAQTNSEYGMFENWWQLLLFVADLVFAAGFLFTLVMFVLFKVKSKASVNATVN